MKISTKGKYGIRAMLDLAIHATESHVPLKSIAERQKISEPYLEQLFSTLKKSGLVISVRGAQGGYKLSRHPNQISVGQILRALEGPLAPVNCVVDDENECERADACVSRIIWERIRDSINKVVDSMTLNDLVEDYNKKSCIIKEKGEYCNG